MKCPRCGRETPDAMTECRHCGASTRPSLWRRLFGRRAANGAADRPSAAVRVRPDDGTEDGPPGIEMPAAGAKPVSFSSSQVTTTTVSSVETAGRAVVPGEVPPELIEQLRSAVGEGGVVHYEETIVDDGSGEVAVTQRDTPLDPKLRAAMEKLLASQTATRQEQIVIDVNGQRHTFDTLADVPPHLRKFLGPFADAPISIEPPEG